MNGNADALSRMTEGNDEQIHHVAIKDMESWKERVRKLQHMDGEVDRIIL